MQNGPGHTGLFPSNTVEGTEGLLNLCSLWVAAAQLGILRTALFDTNGNPVTIGSSAAPTATLTQIPDQDTSIQLLAANADRKGVVIVNTSTAILFVAFGATASASAYTYRLTPFATLEIKGDMLYTGAISGIWASNQSGDAQITELE